MFQPLNIRLVVTYMETWTMSDNIEISSSSYVMLANFEVYADSVQLPFDAMVLFTWVLSTPLYVVLFKSHFLCFFDSGVNLQSFVLGIANIDTMCSVSSVTVVEGWTYLVGPTGSVLAHEIGHLFNMRHDTCNFNFKICIPCIAMAKAIKML